MTVQHNAAAQRIQPPPPPPPPTPAGNTQVQYQVSVLIYIVSYFCREIDEV